MTARSRRLARAGVALLVGLVLLLPLVARAQTTTTTSSAATGTGTGTGTAAVECEEVGADQELTISFCGPRDSLSKTAEFPLSVEVSNNRSVLGQRFVVTSVELRLVRTLDDQQLPEEHTRTWQPDNPDAKVDWKPVFTTNGTYDLEIVAQGRAEQRATATVPLKLAVPPHPPTGVKVGPVDDPAGSVAVTWTNTDREPDVLYYEISRAADGASTFNQLQVVEATENRLVDAPAAGAWRYRVTALRRGGTVDDGVPSTPATSSEIQVGAAAAGEPGATSTTVAGSAAGGRSSTTTARPSISNSTRSTVDLSGFASTLRSGRTPTTVRRTEPDPGFSETLPFDPDRAAPEPEPETPLLELAEAPEALGEELVSDDGERRRSLGFVAFGLLLFVLGMTGLFLKAEVRRVDELETIDGDEAVPGPVPVGVPEPVAAPEPVLLAEPVPEPAPVVESAPAPALASALVAAPLPTRRRSRADARADRASELAALFGEEPPTTAADDDRHLAALAASLEADAPRARADRRVRRTVAPIDAPGLDVPDPVVMPPTTRTATHARRAPTRLPSRPADDRREGGAAVRAGRGGTGQGHRRVPLG